MTNHIQAGEGVQRSSTTLDTIPEEVRLLIFERVPTTDLLNLRCMNSNIIQACNSVLQKRCKVLYIHSSDKSIQRSIRLCEHPFFASEVQEVCLLGHVNWAAISSAWRSFRLHGKSDYQYGREADLGITNYKFRTWPFRISKSKFSKGPKGHEDEDSQFRPVFEEAYKPLIDALACLSKLRKLSFAEATRVPGLNQISGEDIVHHTRRCADVAPESQWRALGGQRTHSGIARTPIPRRSDAEVLYGLFTRSGLKFSELAILCELPFVEELGLEYPIRFPGLSNLPTHIHSLEIGLDVHWRGSRSQMWLYRDLLEEINPRLRHLKINLIPNLATKRPDVLQGDSTLLHLFAKSPSTVLLKEFPCEMVIFPGLEILSIGYLPEKYNASGRPQRPTKQRFDIATFIASHLSTLVSLSIQNVLFSTKQEPCPLASIRAVRELLSAPIASHPDHEEEHRNVSTERHLSYTVSHYLHDPRCRRKDHERMNACTKACGVYSNGVNGSKLGVEAFESLGLEIGQGFDEGGPVRGWNFGKLLCPSDEQA